MHSLGITEKVLHQNGVLNVCLSMIPDGEMYVNISVLMSQTVATIMLYCVQVGLFEYITFAHMFVNGSIGDHNKCSSTVVDHVGNAQVISNSMEES